MSNISMSDAELLKFAIENGILNKELVQQQIEMQKREEMLNKHPYKIYQGNDKNWYTYLPNENGRKKIKANSEDKIKEKVFNFWLEQECNPNVKEVFRSWITKKVEREEISRATYDRYCLDFEKYFKTIQTVRIKEIDESYLEDFMRDCISDFKMTSKCFSNFRTLIYGIFKYAKRKKYINFSISYAVQDMEISARAFKKVVKRSYEQVYLPQEKRDMEEYLMNNLDIINLGLLFMFKTGVRIGELATLKIGDIDDYTVAINATETRYKDESEKVHYDIKEFPKSEAGLRYAILPEKYKWIIDKILELNPNGEYLFEKNGNRVKTYTFRRRLGHICSNKLNMKPKSPHKVRKTYGTILIDGRVKESTILDTMGHTDINCTKGHYYFDRSGIEDKRKELDMLVEL